MQQPQQYRPKRTKRWPVIIAICIVAFVVCVVASLIGGSIYSAAHPQATVQTVVPSTTAHAATWKTLLAVTGNGSKKTAIFAVPGDWKMSYTCSGQNIGGTEIDGALTVTVYGADGAIVDPAAVNATCKMPQTSDVTEEHQAGRVYLDINGTGDWKIVVTGLQ